MIEGLRKYVELLESQIEQQEAEFEKNPTVCKQQLEQKATQMQNAASRRGPTILDWFYEIINSVLSRYKSSDRFG